MKTGKSSVSDEVIEVSNNDIMKMLDELTFIKSRVQVHDKVVLVFSLVVLFSAVVWLW